jgi:hypothetical protein
MCISLGRSYKQTDRHINRKFQFNDLEWSILQIGNSNEIASRFPSLIQQLVSYLNIFSLESYYHSVSIPRTVMLITICLAVMNMCMITLKGNKMRISNNTWFNNYCWNCLMLWFSFTYIYNEEHLTCLSVI